MTIATVRDHYPTFAAFPMPFSLLNPLNVTFSYFSFPMDLDVRAKATLLGACFLIDYMFFEKKANKEQDGFGML
jgi:hypothetical protein